MADHPRWPLYKKLRRTVQRELEAQHRRRDARQFVTADDVDVYLEQHFDDIMGDLENLMVRDLAMNTVSVRPADERGGAVSS